MRINIRYCVIYTTVIISIFIIASRFPLSNDEAYYLSWAHDLQLSYVDAPAFVAYLTFLQSKLVYRDPLALRFFVIVFHFISILFLIKIVRNHCREDMINYKQASQLPSLYLATFLFANLIPIFGLYGVFILPDCGLILSLSIMLYVIDKIFIHSDVYFIDAIFLGIALGIGLLSKYHILPLGGGLILGIVIDLKRKYKLNVKCLCLLFLSIAIGLVIAIPLLRWNMQNHYASLVFQLQHGFASAHYQLSGMLAFILGMLVYLTPWFSYVLIRYGLGYKLQFYIILPIAILFAILLCSSLKKNILPHWIAPAFWLLIPYTVLAMRSKLYILKSMFKVTATIWSILVLVLLLPNGLGNLKLFLKLFNPDVTALADLLLWQDLPQFMQQNGIIQKTLVTLNHNAILLKCDNPVIATTKWYWTAQLEYHGVFSAKYKIINLDMGSSNFYLWRDNWSNYANCPIMVVADKRQLNIKELKKIITINNIYMINGIEDYKSLQLVVLAATFKDKERIQKIQTNLLKNPHY